MNEKAKTVSAASLAGLFALFALHGEAFFRGALGAWRFLEAITGSADLGVSAFFLAIALATLLQLTLRRLVPEGRNRYTVLLIGEFMSLLVAIHVCWLQIPNRNGIMVGLLAGLSSPFLTRAIMALSTWVGIVKEDRAMPAPAQPFPTIDPGPAGMARPPDLEPDPEK